VWLQVLRCKRLHASAPAAAGKTSKGLHSMVTLQLDSYSADRALLSSTTLSFVELAAPEPKVGMQSWLLSRHMQLTSERQPTAATARPAAARDAVSANHTNCCTQAPPTESARLVSAKS
jgi:hypothetical protein